MNYRALRILSLMYKEFLALFRDPKARFVLIAPPVFQLAVFSFAVTFDVKEIDFGVWNRDRGEKSFELLERFYGSPTFHNITHLQSRHEADTYLDEQRGLFVLEIGETFSRDLDAGKEATLGAIFDGRRSNTSQIVAGYVGTMAQQYGQEIQGSSPKNYLAPRNWFNPNLLNYWTTIPGLLAILTMTVGLLVTTLSVARERELGTFEQLLVSPLSVNEIILGKTIPAMIVCLLEATLMIGVSLFIFQLPFTGSLFLLYLSIFVYALAIIGIGLFLSALCATQQQAVLGTFIFVTPAVLLSGFASAIENMPEWLQYVTYINPTRYFILISRGCYLKAMPWPVVWENLWPMALIALLNLFAASHFFRRRLQ